MYAQKNPAILGSDIACLYLIPFHYCFVKGTPLRSGRATHLKRFFFENLYFLVINVLSVSKLILWYHTMSTIDLANRFKIRIYLLNREKRY